MSLVPSVGQGVCGGCFLCVLFIQRGREKSAKGAYLEISSTPPTLGDAGAQKPFLGPPRSILCMNYYTPPPLGDAAGISGTPRSTDNTSWDPEH